jgi:predicted N-acyltransferase
MSSAVVRTDSGAVTATSLVFRTNYRLDTSLPAGLRRPLAVLARLVPRIVEVPVLALGSPVLDRCPLGLPATASASERAQILANLLEGLEAEAQATGSDLIAVKDFGGPEASWADPVLRERRYARMASLPIAVLDLPYTNFDQYLQSLPTTVRSDLRRKMRQSAQSVHFTKCCRASDLPDETAELYNNTRANGHADYGHFDALASRYVHEILEAVKGTEVLLGWVGDQLVSFALILVTPQAAFAHQIGMRYPIARQNNLYFLNWIAAVRYCIERRIPRLEFGQTCYQTKIRLGCRLEPSFVYVRHRIPPLNAALRLIAPRYGFDRMEAGHRSLH